MLLSSPAIRNNGDANTYLRGIVVTDDDAAVALEKTVAMHGFVDDPTYKGEPVAEEANATVAEAKPVL